jgi:hypothetical protein
LSGFKYVSPGKITQSQLQRGALVKFLQKYEAL